MSCSVFKPSKSRCRLCKMLSLSVSWKALRTTCEVNRKWEDWEFTTQCSMGEVGAELWITLVKKGWSGRGVWVLWADSCCLETLIQYMDWPHSPEPTVWMHHYTSSIISIHVLHICIGIPRKQQLISIFNCMSEYFSRDFAPILPLVLITYW